MNHFRLLALALGMTAASALASAPDGGRPERPSFRPDGDRAQGIELMRSQRIRRAPAPTAAKAPQQLRGTADAEGDFCFYAPLDYTSDWEAATDGLYLITPPAQPQLQFPFAGMDWTFEAVSLKWGWIKDGVIHAANIVEAMGSIYVYEMYTIDVETQRVLSQQDIGLQAGVWMQPFMQKAAYNPNDNCVYGYGSNQEGNGYAFTKAPADDISEAMMIVDLDWQRWNERCWAMCYDTESNRFLGMNQSNKLVSIDLQGNQTVLGMAPISYTYKSASGMTVDHEGGYLYLDVSDNYDYSSTLYRTPVEFLGQGNAVWEKVTRFDHDMTFACFMNPMDLNNPALPASPALDGDTFTGPALQGELTVTMPSAWGDGAAMTGDVELNLWVDGTPFEQKQYACGASVQIPLDLSTGNHEIKMTAVKDGKSSRPLYFSRWFGYDVPETPEIKYFEDGELSWRPVTHGVHGGYMDAQAVVYNVYLNGEAVEGSPTTETKINVTIPQDAPYTAWSCEITAQADGMVSEPALSDPVLAGQPLEGDVLIVPTLAQAQSMTYITPGEYYPGWTYITDSKGRLWFDSDFDNWEPMDAWLITQPIRLSSTDAYYSLTLDAAVKSEWSDGDKFEVWMGTAPTAEAMTTPLLGATHPELVFEEGSQEFGNIFSIPEPGVYYFGIHAVSPVNEVGVMVRNIAITKTASDLEGPAAVTGLSATGADKGVLTADVTFTFPTLRADGSELDPDTEITAVVSCVNTVRVTAYPGDTRTVTVKTEQGDNTIEIYCTADGKDSPAAHVTVFTGVDIPAPITDLKAVLGEDGTTVELSWTPPTEGADGGYIDPEALYYRINYMEHFVYTEGPTDHYTLQLPADEGQRVWHIWVDAVSAAGRPSQFYSATVVGGQPYEVPMEETFYGATLQYNPMTVITGEWGIVNPSDYISNLECGDNKALILLAAQGAGQLMTPLFSTVGHDALDLTGVIFNHPSITPAASLSILTYGMEMPERIGTFSREGNGWTDCTISIPEKYLGRPWVKFYFDVDITSGQAWVMDSFSINAGSGVAAVKEGLDVRPVRGGIEVAGAEGKTVRVYSVDGRTAALRTGTSLTRIDLQPGVYTVCTDGKAVKVAVK